MILVLKSTDGILVGNLQRHHAKDIGLQRFAISTDGGVLHINNVVTGKEILWCKRNKNCLAKREEGWLGGAEWRCLKCHRGSTQVCECCFERATPRPALSVLVGVRELSTPGELPSVPRRAATVSVYSQLPW